MRIGKVLRGLLGVALLGLCAEAADALPSSQEARAEEAIRALLKRYEEAIESKDVDMFRAVKPNLSDDERERLERSFSSIRTQDVEITIVSIDVEPARGKVVLRRRDILNAGTAGEVATAFSQVLELVNERGAWQIESIGR